MNVPDLVRSHENVGKIMEIFHERKQTYRLRPSIANPISKKQIERFLTNGMVGSQRLFGDGFAKRHAIERHELERFASLIREKFISVQVDLVSENLPYNGSQIFQQFERSTLPINSFQLGEQPNIRVGVSYGYLRKQRFESAQSVVMEAWHTAIKGAVAAEYLDRLLASSRSTGYEAQTYMKQSATRRLRKSLRKRII